MPAEASQPLVAVQSAGGAQLARDQLARGRLLLLGVELSDGFVDQRRFHALGPQFLDERPPGQPPAMVPGLDPGVREGAVVDQPDLLEP